MQLTKFLLEATTTDGKDIVLDFMQIESYYSSDTDVIHITTSDGKTYDIVGDMTKMKIAAGQIGVPIYTLT